MLKNCLLLILLVLCAIGRLVVPLYPLPLNLIYFSTENLTKVVDTRSIKVQSEAYIENALCETLKQSLRSVLTVSTLEML